jgi:hypothetical protein
MNKVIVSFFVIFSCFSMVSGQLKPGYYKYSVNNKNGITDALAKEILPPLYRNYSNKEDLYWIMVENDSSSILFNTTNGVQNHYKRINSYGAAMEDGHYMHIQQNDGPSLLINPKTGKTIELGREYADGFQKENNYLFATYYLPDSTIKDHQSRRIDVLDLNNKLQPIVTGVYSSVQRFYKAGTVQKEEYSYVDFDAVLFSLYHQHQLYDKNMKLIKVFNFTKTGSKELAQASSRFLQYKVLPNYQEFPPKIVEPQISVLDPSSMPPPPTTKLMSKKTDKSTTLVYLQREGKDDLPLFTTTANTVYVYNNEVNLYHVNDQFMKTAEVTFEVDLSTGRCLLPTAYWKPAHMKPIP